ncbi:MAG: hypothetical protein JWN95_4099 [Frankiales bacterium]|nr:hypothetical protein [Frankiales bacterium]
MPSAQEYLARVGVPDPGGDPAAIQSGALDWAALSNDIGAHIENLTTAVGSSMAGMHGDTVAAFTEQATRSVKNLAVLHKSTAELAQAQDDHAQTHAKVLDILREIAIQIAISLALMALASLIPNLLAALEARLAILAVEAGRTLNLLERGLAAFLRVIAEIRSGLQSMLNWSLTTDNLSIPLGRAAVEGVRDFAVDLSTNALAAKIEGKSKTLRELLISAGISGAVGALIPGLGRLGFRSGESELFTSADDIYRRVIRRYPAGEGRITPIHTLPLGPADSPAALFDRLTQARAAATKQGLTGSSDEAIRVADELAVSKQQFVAANYLQVSQISDEAGDLMRQLEKQHVAAESRVWADATSHLVAQASGDPVQIEQAAERLAQSSAQAVEARSVLDQVSEFHDQASQLRDQAAQLLSRTEPPDLTTATNRLQEAQSQHETLQELREARAEVAQRTTAAEQLAYALKHNQWRDGAATAFRTVLGDGKAELVPTDWQQATIGGQLMDGVSRPKPWREIVFYDGVKDGFKGALSGTLYTSYQAASGQASAGDIGIAAGLGAAGGGIRGMAKGAGQGRLFPAEGAEEIIWRTGTKGLDKVVRDEIKSELEPPRAPETTNAS